DFQNGFLIAEIFSRYYPSALQIHSFDTGVGSKVRTANWAFLERFFRKHGIPIPSDMVRDMVANKPRYSDMVPAVYTFLTKRVPPPKPATPKMRVRAVTQPKAVSTQGTEGQGQRDRERQTQASRQRTVQMERQLGDGDATVSQDSKMGVGMGVQFSRGDTRPLDRRERLASLRMTSELATPSSTGTGTGTQGMGGMGMGMGTQGMGMGGLTSASGMGMGMGMGSMGMPGSRGGVPTSMQAGVSGGKPLADIVASSVSAVLKEEGTKEGQADMYLSLLDPRANKALCFVEACTAFPPHVILAVLSHLGNKTSFLVAQIVRVPAEYHLLLALVSAMLSKPIPTHCLDAAVALLGISLV
ncbi:hypothetical protein KIPB_007377, partial [Kipferlia bialata]